jgi:hypothetical protein
MLHTLHSVMAADGLAKLVGLELRRMNNFYLLYLVFYLDKSQQRHGLGPPVLQFGNLGVT